MYLRNKYNDEENYDENQLHINSSSFRWRVILVYSFIVVIFCFIFHTKDEDRLKMLHHKDFLIITES